MNRFLKDKVPDEAVKAILFGVVLYAGALTMTLTIYLYACELWNIFTPSEEVSASCCESCCELISDNGPRAKRVKIDEIVFVEVSEHYSIDFSDLE